MITDDNAVCTCGHVFDEHGGDPEYPGSSACMIDGCDCTSYEEEAVEEI